MMNFVKNNLVEIIVASFVILSILSIPAIWVTKSYFEARAYNNITGIEVTTWDALWVELRVQGCE